MINFECDTNCLYDMINVCRKRKYTNKYIMQISANKKALYFLSLSFK